MSEVKNGVFVLSLDFELHWGVWDVATIAQYGQNILGVQRAIPLILAAFKQYEVKATFATVGFLFAKDKAALWQYLPTRKPNYTVPSFNVYNAELNGVGNNEQDDPYHYGYTLLQQIVQAGHEVGTHTFSHYYCLEDGQTAAEFDADLKAAVAIAAKEGIVLRSIVFPRNQINPTYLPVLKANGITHYRGNPTGWIYRPRKHYSESLLVRLCRGIDAYTSLFGHNGFALPIAKDGLVNVPGSRFLKPYQTRLPIVEKLKLRRILNEMTMAAKNKQLYHLWWHPHNFGANVNENMAGLEQILRHYKKLNEEYGFGCSTMGDL